MDFKAINKEKILEVENILKRKLTDEKGYEKTIFEAINYSILAGGKRLRPIFLMETYKLFGGKNTSLVEPFIVAIEMVHTYSLVHDDLPAMDNDLYRRGKKTTHAVFGEAMAILAGDGLLNLAYENGLEAFNYADNIKAYEQVARALGVLANKSGVYGMIAGQVCDIELAENPDIRRSLDRLNYIYKLKTSALIEASMMIGAILAGATNDEIKKVENIASNIGLAFQIQDDILDAISTQEALGKPIKSDMKNNKSTYVTETTLDSAKQKVEELSYEAIKDLDSLGLKNDFLRGLIYKLVNRTY